MARSGIVVLTGAGISAESGLATFRGQDGLWENHRIEDVASPEGYRRDPDLVHRFYNARRRQLLNPALLPNRAHEALVELEQRELEKFLLITQNIDDLHERAGNRSILHMHGSLLEARCEGSGRVFRWESDLTTETRCPCCRERGALRPNIVWFGEMPMGLDTILSTLADCSLFLSIGTSGSVYPAAGFVEVVRSQGRARTVELNLERSLQASQFEEKIYGPATEVVPEFVLAFLRQAGTISS